MCLRLKLSVRPALTVTCNIRSELKSLGGSIHPYAARLVPIVRLNGVITFLGHWPDLLHVEDVTRGRAFDKEKPQIEFFLSGATLHRKPLPAFHHWQIVCYIELPHLAR